MGQGFGSSSPSCLQLERQGLSSLSELPSAWVHRKYAEMMPPGAWEHRKNAEMMPPSAWEHRENAEMMPPSAWEHRKNAEMMPPGASGGDEQSRTPG